MIKLSMIITYIILNISYCYSQWFDTQSLSSTVLLEKIVGDSFVTHGTGFIMYNYKDQSNIIIVTCAHLVQGKKQLAVRVNPDTSIINHLKIKNSKKSVRNIIIGDNYLRIIADLDSNNLFIHPALDIAAFYIFIPNIVKAVDTGHVEIKSVNIKPIPRSLLKMRDKIMLGDETYFIGFPLGYGVTKNVEPIIRSGSVAWLPNNNNFFLLDALSYGGNSGSPVFQKVIVGSKPGDLTWNPSFLLGMVVGHQSIKLENMLSQPNPDELKFEKTDIDLNIGLAKCVFTDDIIYTIEELQKCANDQIMVI